MDKSYDDMMKMLHEAAIRQGVPLVDIQPLISSVQETNPNQTVGTSIRTETISNPLAQENNSQYSTPYTRRAEQTATSANATNISTDLRQIFQGMAEIFQQTFTALKGDNSEQASQVIKNSPMHTFHGMDHESANAFIFNMESHFRKSQITDDTEKLIIISSQLRGSAREWYEPHKQYIYDYETFRSRLKRTFDTTAKRAQVEHTLHTKTQTRNESVSLFIAQKIGLFNRIDPTRPALEKAHCIYRQLLPEIRAQIRYRDFETPEELLQVAQEIEDNIVENGHWRYEAVNRQAAAPYQNTNQNNNRSNLNNNNNQSTRNTRAITLDSTAAVRRNNNNPPENVLERQPPSPCRFCGNWHWERLCPRNPYTQQQSSPSRQNAQQQQGNDRRAGAQPTSNR